VESVALGTTPDEHLIAISGYNDGTVRVWDPIAGTPIGPPLTGHTSTVPSVALGTAYDNH
jgi:WD40 repeat protein